MRLTMTLVVGPFDLMLEPDYQVDCQRVREKGFCAVRTGGR